MRRGDAARAGRRLPRSNFGQISGTVRRWPDRPSDGITACESQRFGASGVLLSSLANISGRKLKAFERFSTFQTQMLRTRSDQSAKRTHHWRWELLSPWIGRGQQRSPCVAERDEPHPKTISKTPKHGPHESTFVSLDCLRLRCHYHGG
jgi:hypothetical protein